MHENIKLNVFLMKTVDNQLTHHGQELKLQGVMRIEANDFFRRATPAVLVTPIVNPLVILLHQWKGKLFFVVTIDIDFNGRDHQTIVHWNGIQRFRRLTSQDKKSLSPSWRVCFSQGTCVHTTCKVPKCPKIGQVMYAVCVHIYTHVVQEHCNVMHQNFPVRIKKRGQKKRENLLHSLIIGCWKNWVPVWGLTGYGVRILDHCNHRILNE